MAQPTYQELKAQAASLMAQAEELRQQEIAAVAREVAAKLNEFKISLADLRAAGYAVGEVAASPKATKARKASGGVVAMKYRDPKNADNEWSGRGRSPRWMQEYLDAGKQKDDFLIK